MFRHLVPKDCSLRLLRRYIDIKNPFREETLPLIREPFKGHRKQTAYEQHDKAQRHLPTIIAYIVQLRVCEFASPLIAPAGSTRAARNGAGSSHSRVTPKVSREVDPSTCQSIERAEPDRTSAE